MKSNKARDKRMDKAFEEMKSAIKATGSIISETKENLYFDDDYIEPTYRIQFETLIGGGEAALHPEYLTMRFNDAKALHSIFPESNPFSGKLNCHPSGGTIQDRVDTCTHHLTSTLNKIYSKKNYT